MNEKEIGKILIVGSIIAMALIILGFILGKDILAVTGIFITIVVAIFAMMVFHAKVKVHRVVDRVVGQFIDDMEHHKIPPSHCMICNRDFVQCDIFDHWHEKNNADHIMILYNAQPEVVKVWNADCSLCHLEGSIREFAGGRQVPIFDGSGCPRGTSSFWDHNWIPRELIWAKIMEGN